MRRKGNELISAIMLNSPFSERSDYSVASSDLTPDAESEPALIRLSHLA